MSISTLDKLFISSFFINMGYDLYFDYEAFKRNVRQSFGMSFIAIGLNVLFS